MYVNTSKKAQPSRRVRKRQTDRRPLLPTTSASGRRCAAPPILTSRPPALQTPAIYARLIYIDIYSSSICAGAAGHRPAGRPPRQKCRRSRCCVFFMFVLVLVKNPLITDGMTRARLILTDTTFFAAPNFAGIEKIFPRRTTTTAIAVSPPRRAQGHVVPMRSIEHVR